MSVTAIELRGLVRRFGERTALHGLTLSVPAGATLAVLGRNGAGKSTLLRILATLLRPSRGRGHGPRPGPPRPRLCGARRIGYLGHDPLLYRDLSGRENLLSRPPPWRPGGASRGVTGGRRDAGPGRGPRPSLSRGMVQRLAICRAVLHRPEFSCWTSPGPTWILGRPSGRLDDRARGGAPRAHQPRSPQALAEADLVLGLRDGRMEFAGPADEVDPPVWRSSTCERRSRRGSAQRPTQERPPALPLRESRTAWIVLGKDLRWNADARDPPGDGPVLHHHVCHLPFRPEPGRLSGSWRQAS